MSTTDLGIVVTVTSLTMVVLVGFVVLLMVVSAQRRARHRAEMAEVRLNHDREVMDAEREAQRQTLQEIGRELHDNLGQLLTVAQMGLYTEMEQAGGKHRIRGAMDALELSIAEVRRMGRTLNSDVWELRSFVAAVTAEAVRLERMGLARVPLRIEGELSDLRSDEKTILFRVFQEIVNNALKHARADTIAITIRNGDAPSLIIADNGRGFDPSTAPSGAGSLNIRRRCALIGFHADLSTSVGQGTTWRIYRDNDGT